MGRSWIFIFFLSSIESGSSQTDLSLQPGGTITILCHYNNQYKHHKKFWCYDAKAAYNFCTIQAYANNTADRVTVTDYPDQNLFTVTMRNLQTGDSGYGYWCAVEIEGITFDVTNQFYITVKSGADPDLSVVESSLRGQEGGGVRVQCLYSARYQSEHKLWCRSKDQSCFTVGRTDPSQNSAVQISDDGGRRSFSVEMSGLKKSDAGWYGCRVGRLEVPVHLSVSDAASGITTAKTSTTSCTSTNRSPVPESGQEKTSTNDSTSSSTPENQDKKTPTSTIEKMREFCIAHD